MILVIALLVFGPKRLPELARSLGKGLAEFRRASNDLRQGLTLEPDDEPPPKPDDRPAQAISPEPSSTPSLPEPQSAPVDEVGAAAAAAENDAEPVASVAAPDGKAPSDRSGG